MTPQLPESLESLLGGFSFHPVTIGQSGAGVYRLEHPAQATQFLKITDQHVDESFSAKAEAQRLEWLTAKGASVPRVLALVESDGLECLLTTALEGHDASQPWVPEDVPRVIEAMARGLRSLHALEVSDCPFDRRLEMVLPDVWRRVQAGLVEEEDFESHHQGLSAHGLHQMLLERYPASEDLVFTHGDFCVPNVIVRPDPVQLSGFVDLGRAGIADRYQDLALITRSLESEHLNPQFCGWSPYFLECYGIEPDAAKLEFYRILDEFY